MPATTNNPEATEEETPAKSGKDAELEYKQLLEEYQRLRDEVEKEVRRMRGGRVFSWHELLSRVLTRKRQDTPGSR